jgi:hypothetical protein
MITTNYLREERTSVQASNPALLNDSGSNLLIAKPRVVQWRIELSRRAKIALKSLNETERKTINELIERLKKIPTHDSLSNDEFRAIDSSGFSVVFIRHSEVIEVTDVFSRVLLDQFTHHISDKQ